MCREQDALAALIRKQFGIITVLHRFSHGISSAEFRKQRADVKQRRVWRGVERCTVVRRFASVFDKPSEYCTYVWSPRAAGVEAAKKNHSFYSQVAFTVRQATGRWELHILGT